MSIIIPRISSKAGDLAFGIELTTKTPGLSVPGVKLQGFPIICMRF